MIFYRLENNIRDLKFILSSILLPQQRCEEYLLHFSCSNKAVMRLDCQILLKSLPNLCGGIRCWG